jgi:NADH-quinone oxidoreductase B subunit
MGLIATPPDATVVSSTSPNWVTTRLDFLANWARTSSLWPMPFGTACCAIEFMASAGSRYDLSRFGMERMSFSPRQADVLICAGRLPFKLAPVIRRIWDQMPQPKWSISMGACASSGGIFDNYSMVQGTARSMGITVGKGAITQEELNKYAEIDRLKAEAEAAKKGATAAAGEAAAAPAEGEAKEKAEPKAKEEKKAK